jgi:hypothetical protein
MRHALGLVSSPGDFQKAAHRFGHSLPTDSVFRQSVRHPAVIQVGHCAMMPTAEAETINADLLAFFKS